MNRTIYDGQIIERDGRRFRVNIETDDTPLAPWEDNEGTGIVRKCDPSHRAQPSVKRPGERPLNSPDRNQYQYYYDWQATMHKAHADGWGLSPDDRVALVAKLGREPTQGEVVGEAVRIDFERLRAWLADLWCYVGVIVTDVTDDEEAETDYTFAVRGVESDCDEFMADVADDLITQCLAAHVKKVAQQKARDPYPSDTAPPWCEDVIRTLLRQNDALTRQIEEQTQIIRELVARTCQQIEITA